MVKIRSIEKIVMRQVRGSLEAFLDNKKNLNWIKGMIEKSGVSRYGGYLRRYQAIREIEYIVLKIC